MALYVQSVPNPAVGADWKFTVPGQYIFDIVAITAQLATTANPTVGTDSSSNGRDVTFTNNAFTTYGTAGPFAGSPSLAVTQAAGAHGTGTQIATRAASTDWNLATFSIGCWVKLSANAQGVLWEADSIQSSQHQGLVFGSLAGTPNQAFLQWKNGVTKTQTGTFTANAWHLIGCTYDGTTLIFYVDGAASGSSAQTITVGAFSEPMKLGGAGGVQGNMELEGAMAGCFVNSTALAAGRWSTYFTDATTVSAAQYKTDVLADSPLALWLMDQTQSQNTRQADLVITDGTNTILDVPTGFTVIAGTSPITFSWQTNLNSSAQIPNGATTVAIPPLILPAGYTIGTRTLDIQATDQWSNINIWWNSDINDGTGGVDQFVYPPGAFLTYQQVGVTP